MKNEVLRIDNGLVKIKGNTILKSLYLQVFAGETLGIIFDNMEEKDALIQLLSGEEKLSHGRLYLNEVMVKGNNASKLIKNYIYTISESSKLLSTLSIQENIFFTKFNTIFIDSKFYYKKTQELFQRYNVNIPANKPVKQLTNMERVTIELLKAVSLGCKLIVLSNITALVNNSELISFFNLVSRLKKEGIAFIVIETFQDIIFEQTNNLIIIKNGKTVGMFNSSKLDRKAIYQVMYKEQVNKNNEFELDKSNPYINSKEVVLKFENVSNSVLKNISFDMRRGEILKILYKDNASADNLIGILKGTLQPTEGMIFVNKHPYTVGGIDEAQARGVCFVEENPTERMLFKKLSVIYNLCMPLANKVDWFWFKPKYSKSVKEFLKDLIDPKYFGMRVSDLPPSVLQKIVYCKWLLYSPKVLVCIKPFLITDMQVNRVTERMINLLADKGIAVLIITSNWPSLNSLKGNTLYLENGKLVGR